MSKRLLSAALIAGLGIAFSASAAQPGTGTITISGRITSASCTISVNGGNSSNATITLPTVQTTDLANPGDATGFTAVTIALSNCVAGTDTPNAPVTQVRPYFEQGLNTDMGTGYLLNTIGAGYATNVEVMLSKDTTTASKVDLSKDRTGQSIAAAGLSSSPSFTFYAAYVAKGGAAGAGLVSTSVQYTLDYL